MPDIKRFFINIILMLWCLVPVFALPPDVVYHHNSAFQVAYQRIESNTSLRLNQQMNLRYIKPQRSARSTINRFITEYPQLANAVFLEDVLQSVPFELFERYYLNDIYLGTLFNTVHFSLQPSKKHYLQFTIPLDPWEPALTRFLVRSPAYFSYPFTWTYNWMRSIPTKNNP
jgi:hypothetical protein